MTVFELRDKLNEIINGQRAGNVDVVVTEDFWDIAHIELRSEIDTETKKERPVIVLF